MTDDEVMMDDFDDAGVVDNDHKIPVTKEGVTKNLKYSAIRDDINAIANEKVLEEKNRAEEVEEGISDRVTAIENVVPSSATSEDKLVSKSYVDEQIQTNTAVNRGDFATYADLIAYEGPVTRNDYATVGDDETHSHECWRYKWNDEEEAWKPEYRINESPMTQAQLAAVNSGVDSAKVEKLNGIEAGAEKNKVNSINGMTGDVVIPGATVDSTLSKTSENPVQNKVVTNAIATEMVSFYSIAGDESSEIIKINDDDHIVGPPYIGQTVRLFFNARCTSLYDHTSRNQLQVWYNNKRVVVFKCGVKSLIPAHKIGTDNILFQAGTTLELVYDGNEYVIIGNPEVIAYTSETVSYRIKADGLIDTHLILYTDSNGGRDFTFPVAYTEDFVKAAVNCFYNTKPSATGIKNTFTKTGGRVGISDAASNIKLSALFTGY